MGGFEETLLRNILMEKLREIESKNKEIQKLKNERNKALSDLYLTAS